MFFRSVIVVEASASHAACARFRAGRGGGLRLEQHGSAPFVLEPEHEGDWLRKVSAALGSLRTRFRWSGPVVLTLPAHLLLTKFLQTPRVDPAQCERIIRFEARQNIPSALSEVVWGSTVVGQTETGFDVLLCAAKIDAVEALCAAAEAAGFLPHCLLPCPLALLAAAGLAPPAPEPGAMLINVGARSTTLVLREHGRNHLRSFSLGGNGVTAEIARLQNSDFASAEARKIAGLGRDVPDPVVAALATRLAQEIKRTVLYLQGQYGAAVPERILLTGGCARLPDLVGQLALRLKLPVARLDPTAWVAMGSKAGAGGDSGPGVDLTDLIGAAASTLSASERTINLLPARFRARSDQRRRQPWFAVAAALGVASLAPPIVHFRARAMALDRENSAVECDLVALRRCDFRNRANLEKLEKVRRRIALFQSVQDRRVAWLALLADLQRQLNEVGDVWLDRLEAAPSAGSLRAPPGSRPTLRLAISGRMLDKANPVSKVSDATYSRVKFLLAAIAGSRLVAAVENEAFDHTQPGVLRFSFVVVPEPSHPL